MHDITFAACQKCQAEGEVGLPPCGAVGPLMCPNCRSLISSVSVTPWHSHIEGRVAGFAERQSSGQIGTRKQATLQSDSTLDRDGLEAELAACLILCPGQRESWLAASGPNRGTDLPTEWTLLPRPVEVKQTRYCDERRGCLIVRPPRNTPGPMRPEYIDDSIYVLMHGQQGLYTFLGWTSRHHLLSSGRPNPIPVRPGQRECWGMHWRQLRPLQSLRRFLPDEASRSRA
jgi:hypothetical protein